jgi:hypothetical protein
MLFPNLPRLVARKRVDQLMVVSFLSVVGVVVVVALLWAHNAQIGK